MSTRLGIELSIGYDDAGRVDCAQCEPAPAGWRPGDEKRISCEECARNTAYTLATFGEPEDGLAVIVCPQCGRDVAPGELMYVTGPLVSPIA